MGTTREVTVEIAGTPYTMTSDDLYLNHIEGQFEPEMVRLFQVLARDSTVILDIGANIGCTALLFGQLARQVYAFEPARVPFQFLEMNVARSGLTNIVIQNLGLGAESGEYPLTGDPTNRSGSFVSNRTQISAGHTSETIVIRSLDEVVPTLQLPTLDLIKIDVEGFEGQVLRGAQQTLAAYRPVVVLELNHWCLNAFQRTSIPDFFDFLGSLFPILLAVDGSCYLNLHDATDRYTVMYHHILQMKFLNLVAAFDESQLGPFKTLYQHGFNPAVPAPTVPPAYRLPVLRQLRQFLGYMKRAIARL